MKRKKKKKKKARDSVPHPHPEGKGHAQPFRVPKGSFATKYETLGVLKGTMLSNHDFSL